MFGKTLNPNSLLKSAGNFEGMLGNPGEILGKYRILDVKPVGSKGLNFVYRLQ